MGNRSRIVASVAVVIVAAIVIWRQGSLDPAQSPQPSQDSTTGTPYPTGAGIVEPPPAPLQEPAAERPAGQEIATAPADAALFGSGVPPQLVTEIEAFDSWETPAAAAARERIAAQGSAAAPGVLAALDDIVTALAAYDPENLEDDAKAYQAIVIKLNHLLSVIGVVGDDSHADRLVEIGRGLNPNNMVTASFYAALDQVATPARSNEFAAAVIADPASRSMQLTTAMTRFWLSTPANVGASALQHVESDLMLNRAMAYRLAINAGRADDVRERLIADVDGMQYAAGGNKQLLYALAAAEEPATFAPRLAPLRLRASVQQSATAFNRFAWANSDEKLAQLPDMVSVNDQELNAAAIRFMLDTDRGDLLEQYYLARPAPGPFAMYASSVPGIENMSHEQRLRYVDEDMLVRLEAEETAPRALLVTATTAQVAKLLGYRLELEGDRVAVRAQ